MGLVKYLFFRPVLPFFLLVMFNPVKLKGQTKDVNSQSFIDFNFLGGFGLSKRFSMAMILSDRAFLKGVHYNRLSIGNNIDFAVDRNFKVAFGVAYLKNSNRNPMNPSDFIKTTSLRMNPSISYGLNLNKFYFVNKYEFQENLRLTNKFNSSSNKKNNKERLSYELTINYQIFKSDSLKRSWVLKMRDKVSFNFGKKVVYNVFDKNAIYLGIEYQFIQDIFFELGYVYDFRQLDSGREYLERHMIRFRVSRKI